MTETRETEETARVSPVPPQVRLSFLTSRTQVDVSLPLDVPLAWLTPELVKLAGVREAADAHSVEEPSNEHNGTVWVLSRHGGATPLAPDATLRETGVTEGELLRLTAQPALSAPTLFDDVVDAAARLNKAGYAGWDSGAARWMAFAGVYGAAAIWVYFLLAPAFSANRPALLGLSAVAALGLAGVAAMAQRSHGRSDVGAALGWSVLPVATAIAWATLHAWGGYALAAGCGAVAAISAALYFCIGTGLWGYLTAAVVAILAGLALAAHTAGIPTPVVGAGLAVIATVGCGAAPAARFTRRGPRHLTEPDGRPDHAAAEDLWARRRSDEVARAAWRAGLASSAALGALAVLRPHGPVQPALPVQWPGLAFAAGCAATLGLYALQSSNAAERAALSVPAAALAVTSCALAQAGSQPLRLTAFGLLLATTAAVAVAGPARVRGRLATAAAYGAYLSTAALIPLALWATGAYVRLGIA
ncbi:type VII secretion integral membrane protein EccD [Mycobacterium sp. 050134]|uniref:type VII secretion integral membrane protein EccD n=1 Tax=Mycobacterium sp. 050134 TaxID=3096111 RepID=UPI002ED89855